MTWVSCSHWLLCKGLISLSEKKNRVRLQVNGKCRRISWQKVGLAEGEGKLGLLISVSYTVYYVCYVSTESRHLVSK